ncbi:MAG: DUF2384 domain-containing protein [Gammaproteobacteria bacterium]|nr:DUF2384 domain-containing protein [Gammaproteobacteria bacterium]
MPQLTATIAQRDYLGFTPTKKGDLPNYKVVPELLQFDKRQISQLGRVAQSSVRYDANIPRDLAERLEQIANIANRVAALFDGDVEKVALWFRTFNPMLGNVTPRDMLRLGRFKRLAKFVAEAEQQK